MAIKALKPRLAEAGKIKIGGLADKPKQARGSGRDWYPPVKYDEFHVTTLERDPKNNALVDDGPLTWHLRRFNAPPEVQAKVDACTTSQEKAKLLKDVKIRKIPVYLHADDLEKVLRTEYTCYVGKSRYKECDGETCTLYQLHKRDGQVVPTGEVVRKPCECPKGPSGYVSKRYWDKKTPREERFVCKPYGEFRCLINLPGAAGPGAVYTLRTTGWNTITSLFGSLEDIRQRCGGYLANIPCLLVLHRGTGKDQQNRPTKFWAVHLEMDVDLIQALSGLRQVNTMRSSLAGAPAPRAIPGTPGPQTPQQQAAVSDEFFPPADEDVMDADFSERSSEGAEEAPPFTDVQPDAPAPRPEPEPVPQEPALPEECPNCGSNRVQADPVGWHCEECGTASEEEAPARARQPGTAGICAGCGDPKDSMVHGGDNKLRCPPCHNAWVEAETGVPGPNAREPGEDREEDDAPAPATDAPQDERTIAQVRSATTAAWREYATRTEHPDGAGALYRGACEAAGFDGALEIETAEAADLRTLETFLVKGVAALKKHEPAPAFEDDIPFD